MSEAPAQLAGCFAHKGRLASSCEANFVVFDPGAHFTVTEDRLYQRHTLSPYLGEKLCGVVKRTYLRGSLVFCDGTFPGESQGREYVRD